MNKISRKKKIKERKMLGKPKGKSNYALKVEKRKKLSRKLGLPSCSPLPIILEEQRKIEFERRVSQINSILGRQ